MDAPSVLIVEDEGLVGLDIQQHLERLGYRVAAVVPSGEECLEHLAGLAPRRRPHGHPPRGRLDGIESAGCIRERHGIPVVFLTAHADRATLDRMKATAPYGYLLKPFTEQELHAALEAAMARHGFEARVRESEQWLTAVLRLDRGGHRGHERRWPRPTHQPGGQALTGWPVAEAVGRPVAEVVAVVAGDSAEAPWLDLSPVLCGQAPWPAEAWLLSRDGTRRVVERMRHSPPLGQRRPRGLRAGPARRERPATPRGRARPQPAARVPRAARRWPGPRLQQHPHGGRRQRWPGPAGRAPGRRLRPPPRRRREGRAPRPRPHAAAADVLPGRGPGPREHPGRRARHPGDAAGAPGLRRDGRLRLAAGAVARRRGRRPGRAGRGQPGGETGPRPWRAAAPSPSRPTTGASRPRVPGSSRPATTSASPCATMAPGSRTRAASASSSPTSRPRPRGAGLAWPRPLDRAPPRRCHRGRVGARARHHVPRGPAGPPRPHGRPAGASGHRLAGARATSSSWTTRATS